MVHTSPNNSLLYNSKASVTFGFMIVNTWRAAGMDRILRWFLKLFANQLTIVFIDCFTLSFQQSNVHNSGKETFVITVFRKNKVTWLNVYYPVALTLTIKCFERMVIAHICASLLGTRHLLQFVHRKHRSLEDAMSVALQSPCQQEHICQDAIHWLQFNLQPRNFKHAHP